MASKHLIQPFFAFPSIVIAEHVTQVSRPFDQEVWGFTILYDFYY